MHTTIPPITIHKTKTIRKKKKTNVQNVILVHYNLWLKLLKNLVKIWHDFEITIIICVPTAIYSKNLNRVVSYFNVI